VVPIFVSSGRSGLTLLGMIFGSHPDLAIAHEPRFLATMAPKHAAYESAGRLDVDRFLADLYSVGNFRRLGLPKPDLRTVLETGGVTNFSDAVRVVFDLYARSRGKTLYGDKTPLYITFMEPIAARLPEARFVHLVRDGRDVTLAYLERDKGPATVAEGAFHWRLRVTRGRDSGRRLGGDRYREFHYEDLIDDTEGVVRQICEFLDLEFQPSMLEYAGTSESFLAEAKNPDDHQHLTMAPTKGLVDWHTEMTAKDLALFEAIAGDALEELGYVRASARPASRPVVWWEWARWQAGRVMWRIKWVLFRKPPKSGAEG
jgi:Sulfotransferase family